jgi:hypothetical protein
MSARRQTIYVRPEATAYEAVCDECASEMSRPASLAARVAEVRGTLRPEADVGFACCRRGHRLVVRRIGRPPAARDVVPLRYGYR